LYIISACIKIVLNLLKLLKYTLYIIIIIIILNSAWDPMAQQTLEVTLSNRRPDDGVLNAETCCHVTDSVITSICCV
jgi:hypothetical protein